MNEPLTRLDYILINMNAHLKEGDLGTLSLTAELPKYFEQSDLSPLDKPHIDFHVGYSETLGRLTLSAEVDGRGKPKKPMKEFCEHMLKALSFSYSKKPGGLGYLWNSDALGVLLRDNGKIYKDIVGKLADSTVYQAAVFASYKNNDRDEFFYIRCMQQDADGPVTFLKSAMSRSEPK